MKLAAAVLIVAMVSMSVIPFSGNVSATVKEYKELNPVHVANTTAAFNIACWGEKLAWSSGWGNITAGTVAGGAGSVIDGQYWGYDLCMSSSGIVWSTAADDVTTRSDIYTAGLSGGARTYQPFNTGYDETGARIDGSRIVYEGYSDTLINLKVSTIGGSSSVTMPSGGSFNYDISGDYVVTKGEYSALQIYNVNGNLEKDFGQGWYATEGMRISGDYICYYDLMDFGNGANVYVKNWKTNETDTIIYHMEGQPGGMDIEGNFVVFSAAKSPEAVDGGGACMFIYDIQAKTTYQVSPEYSMIQDYAVGDGWIAWITKQSDYYSTVTWYDIYAAELPAPGDAPPEQPELPSDIDLEHISLLPTGTSRSIAVGEGISFDHNGVEHAVTLESVNSAGAALTVYSDPQSLTLSIGQTAMVDTNGNGEDDLSVKLVSVDTVSQSAEVLVTAVAESSDGGIIGIPFPGIAPVLLLMLGLGLVAAAYARRKRIG